MRPLITSVSSEKAQYSKEIVQAEGPSVDQLKFLKMLTSIPTVEDFSKYLPRKPMRPPEEIAKDIHDRELAKQAKDNPYHKFTENNLILYSAILTKRKGLFERKRMFLLCENARLFYVDPVKMELRGEVPLSVNTRVEGISFRRFLIHTVSESLNLKLKILV